MANSVVGKRPRPVNYIIPLLARNTCGANEWTTNYIGQGTSKSLPLYEHTLLDTRTAASSLHLSFGSSHDSQSNHEIAKKQRDFYVSQVQKSKIRFSKIYYFTGTIFSKYFKIFNSNSVVIKSLYSIKLFRNIITKVIIRFLII